MAGLINLIVLLCASVAVFANAIELNKLEIETSFLEDVLDPFASERDQSTTIGNCQSSDRLLYDETVDVKAAANQIKERDITFNSNNSSQDSDYSFGSITCIKLLDQLRSGKNASYNISNGGLGQRYVNINLRSQRGQPIQYVVQIYGR